MKRTKLLVVPTLLALAATAACGGDDGSDAGAGTGTGALVDAGCPATIAIQTSWYPEAEYGGMYNLIGPDGAFDSSAGVYSGDLGGVRVEVRAGGPLTGNQQVTTQLYTADDADTMNIGLLASDEAIQNSAKQPTKAVMNYFDKDPQVLVFDPATYDFKSIADIGESNAKVLFFEGSTYMDYLVGSGQIKEEQLDGSYGGGPDTFIADAGKDVQSGLITSEPYKFENEYAQWKKPIGSLLVYDSGYHNYASMLSMLPDQITKYASCLKAFVPMAQQATADYLAEPTAITARITEMNEELNSPGKTSTGLNADAIKVIKERELIADDAEGTLGNFDEARMQKMIDILRPIFANQNKQVKDGLAPADLFTNEFVDPSIGLTD
ncbi:hypothetical protein EDD29_4230 [Actinocorallia herbida]|uniref:ABC-type nitrate/sulfonate/bicarbonate transport system substrate-binding protein n=1 Tax=Actinocorallia herbida TaxID=58109 RepID=A0A3N1CZD1_9ACTN|nr:ABC transporter substrate-binding protein [Actinocorallia herbida]ROO86653.1 hypothetical protein EDD29_4230 [Actinocorallia herbida]